MKRAMTEPNYAIHTITFFTIYRTRVKSNGNRSIYEKLSTDESAMQNNHWLQPEKAAMKHICSKTSITNDNSK